jgi:Rhodanese-like domain
MSILNLMHISRAGMAVFLNHRCEGNRLRRKARADQHPQAASWIAHLSLVQSARTAAVRQQVQKLLQAGAQLIEVLPAKVYEDEHLPGARNFPLTQLDEQALTDLQPERPVIVYCYDAL